METEKQITWDKDTEAKFLKILEQIPDLIRGIAEARVSKKAQSIVKEDNRCVISQEDMVHAFFAETPPAFKAAMKASMQELGIDYTKCGYEQ